MQICGTPTSHLAHSSHNLNKIASMPSFQLFGQSFSATGSCENVLHESYWRSAIKFILKLKKQIKISSATLHLAISYLGKMVFDLGYELHENNYEKIVISLVLVSAKMIEIYPPRISTLLSKCLKFYTKEDLVEIEGQILEAFNYDMSFTETSYSFLHRHMQFQSHDKIEDAQKLLGLALSQRSIAQDGEQKISLGIIYLIKPSLIRQLGYQQIQEFKGTANRIYNLYLAKKSKK